MTNEWPRRKADLRYYMVYAKDVATLSKLDIEPPIFVDVGLHRSRSTKRLGQEWTRNEYRRFTVFDS